MKKKNKVKELDACKRLFSIEVPNEDLVSAYTQVYGQIQRSAKIPGFRQGKVPMHILKSRYSDMAREEVLKTIIPDFYAQAIEEEGLKPIGLPKIQNVELPKEGGLTFEAEFEIRPDVKLKNYKGLKIKKRQEEISEEELNKALEDLRNAHASYKTLEDASVTAGNVVVCDAQWFVEEKSIQTKKDLWLPIEKGSLPGDLFDLTLGAKVGSKVKSNITIPNNFEKPEFRNKSCNLEIEIKSIKQKELPALDDELAKDLGSFKTLDELKNHIKQYLLAQKKRQVGLEMEDQLIDQLLKATSFPLPTSLVEDEARHLLEDTKKRMTKQGMPLEEIEKQKPEMEKRLHTHAEKQVKTFFILQELASKENISVTDKEIEDAIEQIAKQTNTSVEKVKTEWTKKGLLDRLHWQLMEVKVMDMLIKEAKITEQN